MTNQPILKTVKQFNPQYRITIFTQENEPKEYIIDSVQSHLTCHVSVSRNTLSETNTASVQIYNLSPDKRAEIFQDQYYEVDNPKKHKYIHIEGGYNGTTPIIFKGRILQAYSYRQGGTTDVITDIQAIPFDIFNCDSSHTFKAGTDYKTALRTMAADMPMVTIGAIGSLNGVFQTDTTFDGNTFEQLKKLTGGNCYVDNGVLNTIMPNQVLEVPVPIIADDTVLLETPMRRDTTLEIKTLFLPEIVVGQLVQIKSSVAPNFDGQYKLVGFSHDCLFSKTQSGQRITTMQLSIGPLLHAGNMAVTGQTENKQQETQQLTSVNGEDITPVNPYVANTNWIMPVKGKISSEYSNRLHPIYKTQKFHNGWDISAPLFSDVKAIADGKVIRTGEARGYGKWVVLDHGKVNGITVTSEYGHISKSTVYVGQKVKQGQTIALIGNEGTSTGPHLHLTIREGAFQGKSVIPSKYIKI